MALVRQLTTGGFRLNLGADISYVGSQSGNTTQLTNLLICSVIWCSIRPDHLYSFMLFQVYDI